MNGLLIIVILAAIISSNLLAKRIQLTRAHCGAQSLLMSFTDLYASRAETLVKLCYYPIILTGAALAFILTTGSPVQRSFGLSFSIIPYTLLGFIASLSITSTLIWIISLFYPVISTKEAVDEVNKLSWIMLFNKIKSRGIRVVNLFISVFFEELIFRVITPLALASLLPVDGLIIALLSILAFMVQQLLVIENRKQMIVMMVSSLSIGLCSTLIFHITGTVVASILMHFMYVLFYVKRS